MGTTLEVLTMIRVPLSLPGLFELGKRRGLPLHKLDLGYLVHCQLGELFGADPPSPFHLASESGPELNVLAYTTRDENELRNHAKDLAEPRVLATVDWKGFAQKRLPKEWPAGSRLGYRVRLCPVVRAAKATQHYRKGVEVDAYLTRAEAHDSPEVLSREQVYREWFSNQIARRGGAELLSTRIESFRLGRLARRTHGDRRKVHAVTRPDVTISGELQVTDGTRFSRLLANGVGRHRAFGFGMLLLEPLR